MRKIILVLFTLVFLASCADNSGIKTVYLAHTLPVTHPVHKGMEVFASEAEKQSKGQLKVKIFPDAQLGSEREVLELLQIGSIAMTKVSAAAMSNFAPEYKVLGLPYLFRNKEHFFNVLEGEIGEGILAGGSEFLLKGMCFYDAGSRSFYSKDKLIKTPDDLEGLKIRVMNDQISVNMVNQLGASATPMAYGELYTALQQGVVDGAENNPPSFVTSRHYEVCKYYSLDEHSSLPDVLVMGTKFWNTLSGEEQDWLKSAAKVSAQAQKKFWSDNVEECMKVLTEAGVEIYRPQKSLFEIKAAAVLEVFKDDQKLNDLIVKIKIQGNE